mmetsp:Transcript_15078/g.14650  ORF Transcript_15078/g.14650 Transcript_15078/m.14650 type:complete len:202 (-) Transcript_15078:36-641(-)
MVPVCKNLNSYFKSGDIETLSEFIIKREVSKVTLRGAKNTKEHIMNTLITMLYNYRHQCSSQSSPSQLVLPEGLKMLPLNLLVALKTPALKLLNSTSLDLKVATVFKILQTPMNLFPYFVYPRVYPIQDIVSNDSYGYQADGSDLLTKPLALEAQASVLKPDGVYLLDNGTYIYLYVGSQVMEDFVYEIFGYESFNEMVQN